MNKTTILIIVLLAIIALLTVLIVLPKPSPVSDAYKKEIQKLEKSILQKEKQIKELNMKTDSLTNCNKALQFSYDSLKNTKNQIKIQYREIYRYIEHANNVQLDSIIRANW